MRPAEAADAAELARMLNEFDGAGASVEQVVARTRMCADTIRVFLGELAGRPVGFAFLRLVPHLQGDEPYAELTDLYVDGEARRHGVGRALMAYAEAAAQAGGVREVVVITGFDNAVARAAYMASGYAEWALAMKKVLSEG